MHRARQRVIDIAFEDDDDEHNEDDEFIIFAIRRPRLIRERAEDFDNLDDIDFVTRYRLSKSTVLSILEKIEDALDFETDRLVNVLLEDTCAKNTDTSTNFFFFLSTKQSVIYRYLKF